MSNNQDASEIESTSASWGWQFWIQMILIFVIVKFSGLLGGLVAWGAWSLIAFLVRKYKL